ncbi:MAG: response regulator [Proteobacteria bacterium]|nr:response regulator [Pseudomonadota bacterium]MBU1708759.1 response regulator [Pseudomonadota bacterium]
MTLKSNILLFSFLALMGLITSVIILQMHKSTNDRLFHATTLLDGIRHSTDKIVIETQDDQPDIAAIKKTIAEIPGISRQLQNILPATNQSSTLIDLGVSFIRIGRVVEESFPGEILEKPLSEQIRNETGRIEEAVETLLDLSRQEIGRLQARADSMLVVLFLVLFSYIAGVVFFLFRMVIQPVLKLSRQVKEVAESNRMSIVSSYKNDEIGELAQEFNQLISKRRQAEDELILEVTEHKRTVQELRYSQSLLTNIFENSLPMCITNLNYEVINANGPYYSVFGEYAVTAEKKRCYETRPGEFCHTEMCPLTQIIAGAENISLESIKPDHEGTDRYFIITAKPFLDSDGELAGIVETFQDITKRKIAEKQKLEMEKQIQHVQKLESLGVLAGGIAHDFNNLLAAILGNADLSLYQLPKANPVRSNIQAIVKASLRASELCKQMLAYSGKGKFVVQSVDLNEVVQEMGDILEISRSKKAVLKYNLSENLPRVQADITQIRQIVMNLITNASEAIGDKEGVIILSTGAMTCDHNYLNESYLNESLPGGLYTYLEVSDNGCGMDKETIAKIFDPFFSTKFTGRGLGMAATLGIMRGHGGSIKVYSEPGKGTSIKILFPAAEDQASGMVQETPEFLPQWQGRGTILIIDDEEYVRSVGEKILNAFGFKVLLASGGREGIELFSEHSPEISCILLDLTMPQMDGEETFRELRKIQKDVKVVISSGYNQQETIQRFAGKGLAGFVQKPYQIEGLMTELKKVIDGS